MIYRLLGRTGIQVPVVSFGAGPVSGLMTGADVDAQLAAVKAAMVAGINWFDTAPGYGLGQSEANLGRALAELKATENVNIATKVRVPLDQLANCGDFIRRSMEESLQRLRVDRVTLLQLHNGLTARCNDEPAAISPADVLRNGGVLDAFRKLRDEGLVSWLGLTGTGQPAAMREVIRSGGFDTVQTPYNLLNPSAGASPPSAPDPDYGNIMADCSAMNMGVFAIRVLAGGAVLDQPPSAHTKTTPYFPLDLYERDRARCRRLAERIGGRISMTELAIRFALSHSAVSSAIIGIGSVGHVSEFANSNLAQPLDDELMRFCHGV